MVTVPNNAT